MGQAVNSKNEILIAISIYGPISRMTKKNAGICRTAGGHQRRNFKRTLM
jgi:hypothetical protein